MIVTIAICIVFVSIIIGSCVEYYWEHKEKMAAIAKGFNPYVEDSDATYKYTSVESKVE
jgi:hypothetical protein